MAAFYEKPELLTGAQRLLQHGFEAAGDAIPPPWGYPMIRKPFTEEDLANTMERTTGRC